MTVRYHHIRGRLVPDYVCQREGIARAEPICLSVAGAGVERAIGTLLIDTVTPLTLEVSLAVQEELFRRRDEAEQLRKKHVERLRYEADLAKRRYMQVDPDNRLVADELEGQWNEKLKAHKEALETLKDHRDVQARILGAEQRAQVLALAKDFPRLWNDPRIANRERKRMVRLLLEDVTLNKGSEITAHVRFKGGTTQTLYCPLPPQIGELRKKPAKLVAEVDRLLDDYTHGQIAAILTHKGKRTVDGTPLNRLNIRYIQQAYGLVPRYERLRNRGMLTLSELAEQLGVARATVKNWNQAGFLRPHLYNDRNDCLFEPMGDEAPVKGKHKGLMKSLTNALAVSSSASSTITLKPGLSCTLCTGSPSFNSKEVLKISCLWINLANMPSNLFLSKPPCNIHAECMLYAVPSLSICCKKYKRFCADDDI